MNGYFYLFLIIFIVNKILQSYLFYTVLRDIVVLFFQKTVFLLYQLVIIHYGRDDMSSLLQKAYGVYEAYRYNSWRFSFSATTFVNVFFESFVSEE